MRIIDEYVKQLDIKKLGFKFAECPKSVDHLRDMIKLYVYGYLNRESCALITPIRARNLSKYRGHVASQEGTAGF